MHRLDVERSLRCDVVYYVHTYEAYVLVQYSCMERVGFYVEAAPVRLQALLEHSQAEVERALRALDGSAAGLPAQPLPERAARGLCVIVDTKQPALASACVSVRERGSAWFAASPRCP